MSRYLFLFLLLTAWGCANKVTPEGGAKDTTPPKVEKISPEINTTGFNGKQIEITFDEYVQLKDIGKQLVVSPVMNPAPEVLARKKSIIINLPDTLLPNTTYSISFGNAIADIHEGNSLSDFRYVFSTGAFIDSLRISGNVINSETGLPQGDALVMLYDPKTPDSLVFKKLPDYFGKTSSDGKFIIGNVRNGSFKVVALTDKNSNYFFDKEDELVGFIKDPVTISDSTNVTLSVFKQIPGRSYIKTSSIEEPGKLLIVFSRPVQDASFKPGGNITSKLISQWNLNRDSLRLFLIPPVSDSVQIILTRDAGLPDTIKFGKSRGQPTQFKHPGWGSYPVRNGDLLPSTNPVINWQVPVASVDESKCLVYRDSVVVPTQISFDDSLKTKMTFHSEWKENNYSIKLLPGAVTDIFGRQNDTIDFMFRVPGEKERGSISVKLIAPASGNFLLQLVNDKFEVKRSEQVSGVFTKSFEKLEPGFYKMRLVTDSNNNGSWDSGDFYQSKTAEQIQYYPESITVRSNWDVELNWNTLGNSK